MTDEDKNFMRRAIELARQGMGFRLRRAVWLCHCEGRDDRRRGAKSGDFN